MPGHRDPNITDLERRLSNSIVVGRVSRVDHAKNRYRVKVGELETDWIPMAVGRAGTTRTYSSATEGEQVVIASPSGDLSQGVIVGSVATSETQAADQGNIHRTVYPDGTTIEYDHDSNAYRMVVAGGGAINMTVEGGGINITCETAVVNAAAVELGGAGGKPVARVGDMVNVGSGSSAGMWPIVEGSGVVRAVD